ncbi:MAG: M14 family metallopeptidase [Pyrinomonadaceae bacterium]
MIHARRLALVVLSTLLLTQTFVAQRSRTQTANNRGARASAIIPTPAEVLGFTPGDDRKLASWSQTIDYFRRLDAASNRVRFEELGRTTMDVPFVMATISAPENLLRLDEYKNIQRQLADPRTLGRTNDERDRRAEELIRRGKTIVLITCGIHSTEVGSHHSSFLIAHRLASSDDPEVQRILRDTIVLLVPSLNPDGVDIVKSWYDRTLNTPYEGTTPPVLYHKYVGHDNNRDWYAFTQKETQITVDKIHNVWHPQIVHDIHQQGTHNSRLFLPPYMPPVEPNVPKEIIEGYTELGRAMATAMRAKNFKGITTDSSYDAWTPARAYSHYHGGVRILSETASARLATPITVRFEDLRPDEGYDPRKVSTNFPELWRGGEWHMRDITNYMTTAAFELMNHAAANRERWLRRFYGIGKEAVRERKDGELFAFIIPPDAQERALSEAEARKRRALLNILGRGGVELERAQRFAFNGKTYPKETIIVPMAQPYGNLAKALLEPQRYPNLRDNTGNPVTPYDVTAHTLPLLIDVNVEPAFKPFRYEKLTDGWGYGGGHGVFDPRYVIYKSHIPSMDEGWTRWVIESSHYFQRTPAPTLEDAEARAGNLRAKYDTILLPDHSPRAILNGYPKGAMPDEYTGGLGAEGVQAFREFVEAGGTLVCLNRASRFAIEALKLPVRDVTEGLKRTEFYVPGSILRTELDTSHPIAAGMPRESIAWAEDSPVFEISDPTQAARVRVIARYPANADPLLSGWLLGGERLKGKAALVEVTMGKGRVVLFGFRPQYRGQSMATYPLLFNAIALQNVNQ